MSNRKYAKTPTVYQMEETECGAASLSMILGYFGRHVSLEQMRTECGVSRNGSNAKNILKAGRRFGLEVHGYRKDLDSLLKLDAPCILHWNFNHFVVWEGKKGRYCYINDPAEGRRRLTLDEVDDCFTGVVLTFEKTGDFTTSRQTNTLFSFVRDRLRGQGEAIVALIVIGLLMVFPGIVIPVFSQVFIDGVLVDGNESWVTGLLAAMFFTMVFRAALTYYRGMLLQRLQNKMALVSTHGVLTHFFRLPISFFDQRYAGDLAQRVENNNNISVFLTSDVAETVLNCMVAVFYLILLVIYSPMLTAIGVFIMILNLVIMKLGANSIEDITLKEQQDYGRLVGNLYAGIAVSDSLKASGTENEYAARLQGYYAKSIETEQKLGHLQEILDAIPEISGQITTIIIMIVGGVLVIRGELTEGMLVAFNSLLGALMEPVNELAEFVEKAQTAKADMRRVEDIMRYKVSSEFEEHDKADVNTKLSGEVSLSNVTFGYSRLEEPLIDDLGFDIPSGRSLAIVGASGSGKSTVSKICNGLYEPWGGEVMFDGMPLSSIPEEVFAASVSTVNQNICLFSGTVRDNLTMWNRHIPQTDVIRAAKDACIHDVITAKPGAYDHVITEGGSDFSGGQRQRLEIARALVTNPSIIIMDEATSALDPLAEKEIMNNIKRRGCTCIIVAHRLSAIRDCDEIIVMEHGRIVQRGSHEKLAFEEGQYKQFIQDAG